MRVLLIAPLNDLQSLSHPMSKNDDAASEIAYLGFDDLLIGVTRGDSQADQPFLMGQTLVLAPHMLILILVNQPRNTAHLSRRQTVQCGWHRSHSTSCACAKFLGREWLCQILVPTNTEKHSI